MHASHSAVGRRRAAAVAVLTGVLTLGAAGATAHTGEHMTGTTGSAGSTSTTDHDVLVLGSSVSGGAGSVEAAYLASKGYAADIVSDSAWAAMTAAQFAAYDLIVVGDPTCNVAPAVVSQNATALADAVMGRADGSRAGNRVLIGTDPVYHYWQGGKALIEKSLDFAAAQPGVTNLYLTLSCYDADHDGNSSPDVQDKLLPKLSVDPAAAWTQNQGPPCGGAASLISNAAQFATLSSSDVQGWYCSVHMTFPTFPTDWSALAVATDSQTDPTCGVDVATNQPACGEAYVLIAGSGIVRSAPNLALDPLTDEATVGTADALTATVADSDGTVRPGVPVSFVVTGANAGASGTCLPAGCATGSDGKVTYTYTGTTAGEDTINAAAFVDGATQSASATKTWTAITDSTPPVIDALVTGTQGTHGWYTSDVGVGWTVSDPESAVSSRSGCDGSSVTADVVGVTLTCTATSAGGTASRSVTVARDATPPVIALVGAAPDGATLWTTTPAPTCTAGDSTSGLAAACAVTGWTGTAGTRTVTASVSDVAGHTSSVSRTYTVRDLASAGFFSPVDMNGIVNVVKAGSTVPLKFTITIDGVPQTSTALVTGFTATKVSCVTGAASDDIEFVTTGGTALRYDSTAHQFVQNWRTPSAVGSCYRATAVLADGESISALFRLK